MFKSFGKSKKSRIARGDGDPPPPYNPLIPSNQSNPGRNRELPKHLAENGFLLEEMVFEIFKMNQAFVDISELVTEKYDHIASFEEFHLLAARMFTDAAHQAKKLVDLYKGHPS
jgi:hypothetical protein